MSKNGSNRDWIEDLHALALATQAMYDDAYLAIYEDYQEVTRTTAMLLNALDKRAQEENSRRPSKICNMTTQAINRRTKREPEAGAVAPLPLKQYGDGRFLRQSPKSPKYR